MKPNEKIFVYGAGGHGKVIIDILHLQGVPIGAVIDDDEKLEGNKIFEYIIINAKSALASLHQLNINAGIIAIGENPVREEKARLIRSLGYDLITAVHPSAVLSRTVTLGAGTAVMAGVMVNSDTTLGENVVLNTGCTVDHDCRIGQAAHISPGAHLGGNVAIGDRTQIGIGAVVLPNLRIGNDVMVGGGAAVIRDLPDGVTAVGVPARIIRTKT